MDRGITRLALGSVRMTNHPRAFLVACLIVVVWAIFGPPLGYSDTWQLSINTGTTIATFLLGFLTQYALTLAGEVHRERVEASLDRGHEHRSQLEDKIDQLTALLHRPAPLDPTPSRPRPVQDEQRV